jgi:beta-lactam-binding protein with PASTA domain
MAAGTCVLTGCAKKVVVPDVSQQDLDQAQKTLAAGNLKPGNISGSSGTGAYVVSQSPAAGQQVSANSAVDLVVALPVTVPNLTGGNLTDAVSTLQGLGLKVAFVQKPTMNIFAKAKVEQQEPPATSLVHGDAIVTLTVSTSPNIAALLGLATKEPAYQNFLRTRMYWMRSWAIRVLQGVWEARIRLKARALRLRALRARALRFRAPRRDRCCF